MVEEVESRDRESSTAATGGGAVEEDSLRNDVYTAAAYGDMEKLQRLVEREGASVSEPDGLGYYALQWAALNNRTAAAQYIIEVYFPLFLLISLPIMPYCLYVCVYFMYDCISV